MVIRELLDNLDREIKSHRDSILRLSEMRDDILSCCRKEKKTLRERKRPQCEDEGKRKAA
jgi:hypothetical protein